MEERGRAKERQCRTAQCDGPAAPIIRAGPALGLAGSGRCRAGSEQPAQAIRPLPASRTTTKGTVLAKEGSESTSERHCLSEGRQ